MSADLNMNEIHWLMDMFNTVDVGLVVLDREYKVCVWNGFMENHSGLLPSAVKHKDLFDLFPAIDEKWFRSKSESVFVLKNRSFTIWEQQPYIFRFKNSFYFIRHALAVIAKHLWLCVLLWCSDDGTFS